MYARQQLAHLDTTGVDAPGKPSRNKTVLAEVCEHQGKLVEAFALRHAARPLLAQLA